LFMLLFFFLYMKNGNTLQRAVFPARPF